MAIVDEFSMSSCADLFEIDRRLKIAKSSSADWGGLHILFGGDFYQVIKHPLEKRTRASLFSRCPCASSPTDTASDGRFVG